MIPIGVIDEHPKFPDLIKKKLADLPDIRVEAAGTSVNAIEDSMRRARVSVMLFGPSFSGQTGLKRIEEAAREYSDTGIMLMTDAISTELLSKAMRAGVRDVVQRTIDPVELNSAIVRADAFARQVRSFRGSDMNDKRSSSTDAPIRGRAISLIGSKGGIGKSFVATNLAVALAGAKNKVILVDLDLEFGDIAVIMQLYPKHTLSDVIEGIDRLDAEMMSGFLTEHDSGVLVLASPIVRHSAKIVTADEIGVILHILKTMADYVIIDTPATFNEIVKAALNESDQALVLASTDIPSVKDAKVLLGSLNGVHIGHNGTKPRLIVNRSDSRVGLESEHIADSLKTDVYATIPSSRLVPVSINQGVPLVVHSPKSPVGKSLNQLARMLTDEPKAGVLQEKGEN